MLVVKKQKVHEFLCEEVQVNKFSWFGFLWQ